MPSADSWETNDTRLTATNLTGYSGNYGVNMTIDDSTDCDWIKIRLTTNGTSANFIGIDNIVGGDIDKALMTCQIK